MKVSIYLNVAMTTVQGQLAPSIFHRFDRGYIHGDPLAQVMDFDTEAESPLDAAEMAFEIGNVDPDWVSGPMAKLAELVREYRGEQVRSLSVGDVVVVDDEAYACMSMGFDLVGPAADLAIIKETAAQATFQVRWANKHGLKSPLLESLERA